MNPPPPPCCHRSYDEHLAEVALLAALLVEHDLVAAMIVGPRTAARSVDGLIDAHRDAATALAAWRAAGPVP